jgi:hypothetical protein
MSQLVSTTAKVIYKDEEGNILLEGFLLDLAHLIGFATLEAKRHNPEMSHIELAKLQATAINKEFNSTLTWGQTVELANHVRQELEELKKKKSSQEQELPQPLDSTLGS